MAKVQSTQTGEVKEVDSATQGMSDSGGFVPVSDDTPITSAPDTTGSGGGGETPGDIASKTTEDPFAGVVSPMSAEEIASKKAEEDRQRRELAGNIFDPMATEARNIGEKREGGTRTALGETRGLGLSTAGASYIASVEKQTQDAINEIEAKKAAFISSGDIESSRLAEERLDKLRNYQLDIIGKKNEMAQQVFMNEMADRSQALAEEGFKFDKEKFNKTFGMTQDEFNYNLGQFDRDMATNGFRKLDPSDLSNFSEDQIMRVPNALTGNSDIYLVPEGSPELYFTTGVDNQGNKTTVARNKQTGEVMWESTDIGIDKAKIYNGSGTKKGESPVSYDMFQQVMSDKTKTSQDLTQEYNDYVKAFNENVESLKTYTTQQKNILEANGLLNASRVEQLDFLYNKEEDSGDDYESLF